MRLRRPLGGKTLAVACDPALREQAEGLLDALAGLDARGPALRDGSTIQFGWSRLTLRADGPDLLVHEPDFAADPRRALSPRVDHTLRVLVAQTALLRTVGLEGDTVPYDGRVLIARGVLEEPAIYMERKPPVDSRDSGWYVGPTADRGELGVDDLELVYVHDLLRLRPALLALLPLPVGTLAVLDTERVTAIFDANGNALLGGYDES